MKAVLGLILLALPLSAMAGTHIVCSYTLESSAVDTIMLDLTDDGAPAATATVTTAAGSRQEAVTPDNPTSDELAYVWLEKSDPNNGAEMIVYRKPNQYGQSLLISSLDPQVHMMLGSCTITPK